LLLAHRERWGGGRVIFLDYLSYIFLIPGETYLHSWESSFSTATSSSCR
jgi:hypothetical protein